MLLIYLLISSIMCHEYRTAKNKNSGKSNTEKKSKLPVQWVEERDNNTAESINMDIFFDRVVMIGVKASPNTQIKIVNTGVLFDSQHVLTSYNPLRKLLNTGYTSNIVVTILTGRKYNIKLHNYEHKVKYYTFACHRQAVVVPDSAITPDLWHGEDKRHSPLHDLLVIKINVNLTLLDPDPSKYSFNYISSWEFTETGPMVTELADEKDMLGPEVKFASLGFRSKDHMLSYNMLSTKEYSEENNVIADCDEWMIRDWGHFICINNEDMYEGIGSGALLIYDNKLYGVGSFTLKKGNISILVFTDVRPYRKTIFKICIDKKGVMSKKNPKRL